MDSRAGSLHAVHVPPRNVRPMLFAHVPSSHTGLLAVEAKAAALGAALGHGGLVGFAGARMSPFSTATPFALRVRESWSLEMGSAQFKP